MGMAKAMKVTILKLRRNRYRIKMASMAPVMPKSIIVLMLLRMISAASVSIRMETPLECDLLVQPVDFLPDAFRQVDDVH